MTKLTPSKILFIKLGEGGNYEKDCIETSNALRLGYKDVDHELCKANRWDKVYEYFLNVEKAKPQVATSHTNQIKQFYNENERTLWITFYANRMWWCFSEPAITLLPDKTKTRPVIGSWSDRDANGKQLLASNISGKLLKTQGYRGTICSIAEEKYCLAKINGELLPEVKEVEQAKSELKIKVKKLIQHLYWKDFETLIDLIFRQAGWQRVGDKGKTQKSLDLDLFMPVTGDRAAVQIKSQSGLPEFLDYANRLSEMDQYNQVFYVVHSADHALSNYDNDTDIKLYRGDEIAEFTISSGLVDWLIGKTA